MPGNVNISLPNNLDRLIRSVAVMRSPQRSQSGMWVGPRILISTLHLYHWITGDNFPSDQELYLIKSQGITFEVETEISAQLLSDESPKVKLLACSKDNDLGIFELMPQYSDRTDYVDPNWLIERDEISQRFTTKDRRVACVGFNATIKPNDIQAIKTATATQLQNKMHQDALKVSLSNAADIDGLSTFNRLIQLI